MAHGWPREARADSRPARQGSELGATHTAHAGSSHVHLNGSREHSPVRQFGLAATSSTRGARASPSVESKRPTHQLTFGPHFIAVVRTDGSACSLFGTEQTLKLRHGPPIPIV